MEESRRERLLHDAISGYERALARLPRDRLPIEHARTLGNLANAHCELAAIRDKEANLKKA
ncbi:MAG: hypothetical protein Q8O76_07605, partial [Chloroflexota bacterium]|nr:hypothetical protein [Chloroflexota bacterium]